MEPISLGLSLALSHVGQKLWDWCKSEADERVKRAARGALEDVLRRLRDPSLPDASLLETATLEALGKALELLAASLAEQLEPNPTLAQAIARQHREGTWLSVPLFERLSTPERRWVDALARTARDASTLSANDRNPGFGASVEDESEVVFLLATGDPRDLEERLARHVLDWLERRIRQSGEVLGTMDETWYAHEDSRSDA